MKRFFKKALNRFLPDWLRAWIKRRVAAKFSEPATMKFYVKETAIALECSIDRDWSFLAPRGCKSDLANLTELPEGQTEFQSLAGAARIGGILFDIGAHSGLISAMFCAAHPHNRAFAFEPSPVLAERLASIQKLNEFGERMRVEQSGIGEETKTMEMILDPAGGFIQSQHFEHTLWAAPQKIQIRLESIADAATRLDAIPQFIKIDIEGYEFEAIKGSIAFLSQHKPVIFLELHLNYLEQRSLLPRSLVEMLTGCGYAMFTSRGRRLKPSQVYDSPLPIVHVVAR